MAVVVFDPAAFKLAYPEFATVPDARLTALFNIVGATILDNTDASVVVDPLQRAPLLDMLVAHMLVLFGYTTTTGQVVPPRGVVGRVASATEGTVSTSLEYHVPSSAGEAWFSQTPYGAMYWLAVAQFRSFRYGVIGRSGVGHAIDFLNRDRLPQLRGGAGGTNSGTPGGA